MKDRLNVFSFLETCLHWVTSGYFISNSWQYQGDIKKPPAFTPLRPPVRLISLPASSEWFGQIVLPASNKILAFDIEDRTS